MKPYDGFKAQKNEGSFLDVPPAGLYTAVIKKARYVEADGEKWNRDRIELFVDISEGDYKDRYMALFTDQKEKWGDDAKYKGLVTLVLPVNEDEPWKKKNFEHNVWAIEDSNSSFRFNWDKLPNVDDFNGKAVGLNIRQRLYTYNGKDRESTEIGRFESIQDIKAGRCKVLRANDKREKKNEDSTDGSSFTDVSKSVDVPW